MKTSVSLFTAMFFGVFGSAAFASGFKCTSDHASDGYNVKLFNHTESATGTRTPAIMVISHEDAGTLLVRRGAEIRKASRANTVQYVVDGNRTLGADSAILQVRFKEGRQTLREGEVVSGQLILISEDGERAVVPMSCERYLKQQ